MPARMRSVSPRRRRMQTVGIFFLTLGIATAVFGGAAWAALRSPDPVTLQEESDDAVFEASPTLYVLVVLTQEKEAESFSVVRLESRRRAVSVLAVPKETEVLKGTDYTTLQALAGGGERGRMEDVCAAISALISAPISKYVLFSGSDVSSFLDYLGDNVIFSVPEPISYKGTLTVRLDAGKQTLSSVQVQGLLSCPASVFSGGRAQYASLRAALIAALYNQYAVAARADSTEADFKAAVNCASSSNLLISDYYAVRDVLQALRLMNEGTLCRSTMLTGSFVGRADDIRFYPDVSDGGA